MSYRRELEAVKDAVKNAERCDRYTAEVNPCDGLDGCEDCLDLAAKAAIEAVERVS